jgi:PAS domain S-box-containing protein
LLKYLSCFTNDIREYHSIFLEIEELFTRLNEVTLTTYTEIQKKNNESLISLKDLLNTVVESSVDGIMAYDKDMNFIIWNRALEQINNLPKEKVIGKKVFDVFPAYNQKPYTDIINSVLKEGKTFHLPATEYKYKQGFYESYVTPLVDDENKIGGVLTVIRDVTEKVRFETILKEKNAFIEGVTGSSPDLIFLFDLKELKHIYLSNEESEILAYNKEIMGEKNILELLHPDNISVLRERREKILKAADSEIIEDEFRALDKNGNWRWVNSRVKVYKRTETGEPVEIVGTLRDVSKQKEAEAKIKMNKEVLRKLNKELEVLVAQRTKELSEKEAQLRIIANRTPALISYVDIDGIYRYVNDTYQTWFNIEPKNIIGQKVKDILGESAFLSVKPYMEKTFRGEKISYETELNYKSGGKRFIRASYVPHINDEGKVLGYVALVIDLTEEKKKDEELRRSQSNLKDFVENASLGLHWVNKEGIIIWANEAEMNMLGYSKEEYIGQPIKKFHADQEVIEDILCLLLNNETVKDREVRLISKDGSIKYALVDSSSYWENGEFIHTRCFTRDITDKKLVEKEIVRKNGELQKVNADLDNFIYTASHDLKAPVSNIEGLLIALEEALPVNAKSTEEVVSILELINVSISRFKNTIRDLTEISKVQKGLQESDQINDIGHLLTEVKSDIKEIINLYGAKINIDLILPEIRFSRKNLRSIFYNLISNAIKYSDPERKPLIKVRTEKIKNDTALILVEDNGLGIADEYKDKIFSMFKRAHDHVDGSGIGLYIVKRIVENNGGNIELESQVGKGSIFKIYLRIY